MRKFTLITALVCLGWLGSSGLMAQRAISPTPLTPTQFDQEPFIPITQRTCASVEKQQESLLANPGIELEFKSLKEMAQQMIAEQGAEKTSGTITIPTVVHVVYRNAAGNISAARVQEQIDVLNQDFGRTNPDASNTPAAFLNVAASCQVQFCLASKDPQGNATTGITRRQTTTSNIGSTNQYYQAANGTQVWDRSKYMNIWVCEIGGGTLGFAYKPSTAPAAFDGIVIDYRYFGKTGASAPFNRGRTATHEVGHWLGLDHIWGDGNCSVDDGIADTPESDAPNYNCPTSHVSCGTTDMVQNYMDYTNDACMNLYTNGQCAVVNSTLSGARGTLVFSDGCSGGTTPTNCGADTLGFPLVGTPVIYSNGGGGYVSGHNSFVDLAKASLFSHTGAGTCSAVRIQFGIATSSGSSAKVVVKVWDEVGGEPGTVLAQKDLLIDDILSMSGDVVVSFASPATLSGNFFAGVELIHNAGDTVAIITNTDGDVTTGNAWEQFSDLSWHAYNSSSSWGIDVDHAIFPILDGTSITVNVSPTNPTINAGSNVTLSASGGSTYSWSPSTGLNTTTGANVIASPSVTTTYTVTGTDATGNCTDQQQVTVTVIPVAIEAALFGGGTMQVYPNPNNGSFMLEFNQSNTKDMNISITNVMGQVVYTEGLSGFAGTYKNTIDLGTAAKGIYFLRISDGVNQLVRKVIVE